MSDYKDNVTSTYRGVKNQCFEFTGSAEDIHPWLDVVAILCVFVGRSFGVEKIDGSWRLRFRYPVTA